MSLFSAGRRSGLLLTASLAAIAFVPSAFAQEAAPAPQDDTSVEDAPAIVVTGSRIARPEFNSPNPIISIGAADLQQSGTTNLTDFLTGFPALAGSLTSRDNSGDRSGIGYTGLNLLDLRNLGTDRTLVLVDGRRHVASVPGSQAIDINSIPTDLVQRIDVLTGGASAVYGADGVTGVVNFVLKKDFQGITARAQAGISERGDAGQRIFSITAGTNFAGGRGNVAVAYEYGADDRMEARDRDYLYGANRVGFFRNPAYVENTPGSYLFIPTRDVRYPDTARNGAIDVTGDGIPEFTGTGAVYDEGTFIPGGYTIGGSSTSIADYSNDLLPEVERHVVNAVARFEVSDSVEVYAEGKYANVRSFSLGQPTWDYYLFIPEDNPYIPDTIRAAIDPAMGGVLVTRDNLDFGQRGENIQRETWRGVIGVRGQVSDSMRYDLSYVYGRTNVTAKYVNDIYDDRFFAAIDAVSDGNGGVTCRVNVDPTWTPNQPLQADYGTRDVTNPTTFQPGACSPINLFGEGQNQAGLDFIRASTTDRSSIEQHVVSGSVSGNLFTLPGGDFGYAVGAEYRRESANFTPDPIAEQGLTFTNALSPTRGAFDVKEVFAEVRAPLLGNMPFVNSLEIGGAARFSDYSTTGTSWTWKVDGSWSPVRDIRVRGTYSKAVRAPNIGELFGGASQTFTFFDDPCNPVNINGGEASRPANCAALLAAAGLNPGEIAGFEDTRTFNIPGLSGGNPGLAEEKATTWTVGAVLQPRFLPGLTISADWYDIKLANAINTVDAQELAELCVDQADINNIFCDGVTRQAGTGLINGFSVAPQNVASFRTAGLDVNVNYRLRTANLGTFNFSVIGNYLNRLEFIGTPGAEPTDSLRTVRAPEFQATGDITWTKGPFTLNYGLSWADAQRRYSANTIAGNPNYVAPEYVFYKERWVHDVYGAVTIDKFQLFGGINNFTDQRPDIGTFSYPVDTRGRYFYAGARVGF
jgi:iron complex outermembrane receptor protein